MSCEQQNEISSTPKVVWVVNPFDQLPNETDLPLRYWTLCRVLAEQGHEVIWWSSDFSHLSKTKRPPCPDTDGFVVRLIETPPYTKNISIARLRNHKAFGVGFYKNAITGLKNGTLKAPDRIVVSLPPLGVAEQAFKIRDMLNQQTPSSKCEVIVDIQDAWPEVFYQLIPRPLRRSLGPLLLRSLHSSARSAYRGADKISAVGQSYLDLATTYLASKPEIKEHQKKPTHLCYLGADLTRFQGSSKPQTHKESSLEKKEPLQAVYIGSMGSGYDLQSVIDVAAKWKREHRFPCQIHFAGDGPQLDKLKVRGAALGLLTWKRHSCRFSEYETSDTSVASTNNSQARINPARSESSTTHSLTSSTQSPSPKANHPSAVIKDPPRIVFHGYVKKDALNDLLINADLALVPNRPDSLVACPNKACEYAAAGLPMISCLGGELGQLLAHWNAGTEYKEGDVESLHAAFEQYFDLILLKQQSLGAQKLAAHLFDRKKSYQALLEFILH